MIYDNGITFAPFFQVFFTKRGVFLNITGIIAEFNPFHNGHKHLVDSLKKDGDSTVTAVMSGNFVQRGEIALCDKWTRTKIALLNGVDLDMATTM